MGEVIRKISEIKLGGREYAVELNNAPSEGEEREIHIQSDSFRLALPESEFLQICATVLLAKKQLEQIKGEEKLEGLI